METEFYDFSGTKIGIRCEKELKENSNLRKFSTESNNPDYLVELEFCAHLPDAPVYRKDGGTECFCAKTKVEAGMPERPFVCTEYSPDGCRMRVIEEYRESFDVSSVFRNLPLHYILHKQGAFILHASYILVKGEAILFSAPCGTGKSTQAELWKKYRNAEIINGDRVIVSHGKDGFTAGGIYYSGTSDYCENVTAPIRSIVLLEQAKENTAEKCGGMEAFRRLFSQCTYTAELGNDAALTAELVADAVNGMSVVKLACLPDESAVWALESFLQGEKDNG